jgi:hypothetical protein
LHLPVEPTGAFLAYHLPDLCKGLEGLLGAFQGQQELHRYELSATTIIEGICCWRLQLTESFGSARDDLALGFQDLQHYLLVPLLPLAPQEVLTLWVVLADLSKHPSTKPST